MSDTSTNNGISTNQAGMQQIAQTFQTYQQALSGIMSAVQDDVNETASYWSGDTSGTFRQKIPSPKRLSDDQLGRIVAPTLLLLGADTRLYDPDKVAERARRLLPDVMVEITPGAGHGLPLQYPDRITRRVLDFVETRREPRTGAA